MRLINADTLKVEEFGDNRVPEYAILSHRWEEEEVTLRDMEGSSPHLKKGYSKIQNCCRQAQSEGFKYVWVDTCCIDKTSSAELSEAINSMFRWYRSARVCYAYLSDVENQEDISKSLWFTRGWTLQELLGPHLVTFFNRVWIEVGTKNELAELLAETTGIDISILQGEAFTKCSVAKRMFWASKRITTRIEDQAYCLLGIFDVNMPLLYGEGKKAFIRLQEEIIKRSNDQSIFGWSDPEATPFGLLAPSPSCFATSHDLNVESDMIRWHSFNLGTKVCLIEDLSDEDLAEEYTTTNLGISIKLFLCPWYLDIYLGFLLCSIKGLRNQHPVALYLQRVGKRRFVRISLEGKDRFDLCEGSNHLLVANRYLQMNQTGLRRVIVSHAARPADTDHYGFSVQLKDSCRKGALGLLAADKMDIISRHDRFRRECEPQSMFVKLPTGSVGFSGILISRNKSSTISSVLLGFDFEFNPICVVIRKRATHLDGVPQFLRDIAKGRQAPRVLWDEMFSSEWVDRFTNVHHTDWVRSGIAVLKVERWSEVYRHFKLGPYCVRIAYNLRPAPYNRHWNVVICPLGHTIYHL